MNSIGCLWNSAANTRLQLLATVNLMVHFPLTFQLLTARIRHHAPSDHRTRNFWKSLNAISNLLVTVLSFSLLQLSWIHCLSACGISPPSLTSKPSSDLSFFNRHFHRCRRIIVCVCVDYVDVCVYICVNGVCWHNDFSWREDLRYTRAIRYHYYYYYYYYYSPAVHTIAGDRQFLDQKL